MRPLHPVIYPVVAPLALALPLLMAGAVTANPTGNRQAVPVAHRNVRPGATLARPAATPARPAATPARPQPAAATPNLKMPAPTPTPVNAQRVLYVNPTGGQDTHNGQTPQTAFRTITHALKVAEVGTLIQLAPGRYSAESGEQFPLNLKPGVILRGNEATRGEGVLIEGGGRFISRIFARQNATILAGETTQILGVTITNRNVRGTAIWVESTNPHIRNSTFVNNHREGVFVTGQGAPRIEDNLFIRNGGNGVSLTRASLGEVRRNVFIQTGFGLAIGGVSAPIVTDNRIENNVDGVVISDIARPVLRGNRIAFNQRTGIIVISNAQPDLGTTASPGNNTFQNNGNHDLHNATRNITLTSVGNQLDMSKVNGQVQLQ